MFEPLMALLRSLDATALFLFCNGPSTGFLLLTVCFPLFALLCASSLKGELDVVTVRRRLSE